MPGEKGVQQLARTAALIPTEREGDSRSLKQQGPFLNAISMNEISLLYREYLLNKIEVLSLVVDYFRSYQLKHLPHL